MDQIIKQKWVEALRSGEYKQTQNYLKDPTGYCCLGVLAEVCGMKIISGDTEESSNYFNAIEIDGKGKDYQPLRDLIGNEAEVQNLIDMNDSDDYNFNEIANYVE